VDKFFSDIPSAGFTYVDDSAPLLGAQYQDLTNHLGFLIILV